MRYVFLPVSGKKSNGGIPRVSIEMKNPMLMIPGPMDVPDEVLRRCGHKVFAHYDPATRFPEFYNELTEKTKKVFGLEDGDVFIPSGSGTLAVNMSLASLCTPDDEVLILDNGGGEYAEKNLQAIGVPYSIVKGEKGHASDPDAVRKAMRAKRRPFIFMTHNESSTAVLNPIPPIGKIAREFDSLLIVDSVSGVGGVVVEMGENGADVVAGASQKCLELPPGLAPVWAKSICRRCSRDHRSCPAKSTPSSPKSSIKSPSRSSAMT